MTLKVQTKLKIIWPAAGFVALVVAVFLAAGLSSQSGAAPQPASSICRPGLNTFRHTTASTYSASAEIESRQATALSWLRSMMQPLRSPGDGSTISVDSPYVSGYSGPMSGQFSLAQARSTTTTTPLTVTSPSPIDDSYRGVVSGKAELPGPGNYEVRAYLTTDSEYFQPSATGGVVDADGNWSKDLSGVSSGLSGAWHFRLYDTDTNTQIGDSWPRQVTYENLEVRYYLVTDSAYLQSSIPARADSTWSFNANSNSGDKMFRVVDTSTNEILAEYYEPETYGLIRSYEYFPGQDGYGTSRQQNSYVYDQALALLVAIGANERAMADDLLAGLALIQAPSGPTAGAFPSSTEQLDPLDFDESYYTGNQAFVLYAITRYIEAYGDVNGAEAMLLSGLDYIDTLRTNSGPAEGLYQGGREIVDGNLNSITWHSTEHNTDLWHVFERAGRVLDDSSMIAQAEELSEVIVEKLWNQSENRFNQGFNDTNHALDTTSWGSIFLNAIGEYDKALLSVAASENYLHTSGASTGYTPYIMNPDSIPTVWYEGTYGVAAAHHVFGDYDKVNQIIDLSVSGQRSNGGFPYAEDPDLPNGRTDASSVASTAWFLLSSVYPDAIWSECYATSAGDNTDTDGSDVTSGKTDSEFQSGAGVSAPNTGIAKADLGGTFGLAAVLLLGGVGCLVAAAYRRRYQS